MLLGHFYRYLLIQTTYETLLTALYKELCGINVEELLQTTAQVCHERSIESNTPKTTYT